MSIESRSRQYGKVFDHWQIREFLGSGSGGKTAVFRLVRSDSDRGASALKVVNLIEERGSLEKLSARRREEYEAVREECSASAEQEVWMMDDLRGNTNIVDYLDHTFVDWEDETGFGRDLLIRMELLRDLRSELRRGRLFTESEVLKVGRDICVALILCHRKNILHRDVKPENIFLNKDGAYKLGDFGVSRVLDACPGAVASTGIGTYEYWPAEQMTGRYDTRVDTYSLGLVLYELSNKNRLPFAASAYTNSREVSQRLSGTPLPPPCDASPALAEVILKACAYDPEDRFASAGEMLKALQRVSAARRNPPSAQPVTLPADKLEEKKPEKAAPVPSGGKKRRKLWAVFLVLAVLAAAGAAVAMGFPGKEPASMALPAETTEAAAVMAREETVPVDTEESSVPETSAAMETKPSEAEAVPESKPTEPVPTEQVVLLVEDTLAPSIGIVNGLDSGVNIRSGPGTDAPIIGRYSSGTYIEFLEITDIEDVGWGRTKDGWICLNYVFLLREQGDGEQKTIVGRVTTLDTSVNIRPDPRADGAILGEYKAGTNITILEITDTNGVGWGRTKDGWVCLEYVCLLREQAEDKQMPIIGRVNSRSTHVNIRREPTSTSKLLGNYYAGTMIDILETTQVNGIQWGRTEDGWVCMTYVNMIPQQEEGEEPVLYTGWVILTTELNVRQMPSVQTGILKRLRRGDCVNIYETCVAEGKRWGRCDDGWIDLYHIDLLPVDLEYNDVRIVEVDKAPVYSDPNRFAQVASCEKLEMVLVYKYVDYGEETMCQTEQGWISEDCFY